MLHWLYWLYWLFSSYLMSSRIRLVAGRARANVALGMKWLLGAYRTRDLTRLRACAKIKAEVEA
jgi:hypothetical protein